MIDISKIDNVSFGGAKIWLMARDDATDYCWTMLLKSKDELPMRMIELIKEGKDKTDSKSKRLDVTMLENIPVLRNLFKQKDYGFILSTLPGRCPGKMAEWKGNLPHIMEGSDQC